MSKPKSNDGQTEEFKAALEELKSAVQHIVSSNLSIKFTKEVCEGAAGELVDKLVEECSKEMFESGFDIEDWALNKKIDVKGPHGSLKGVVKLTAVYTQNKGK